MMAPLLLMIVNKKLNEKSVLRKPVMRGKKLEVNWKEVNHYLMKCSC